VAKTIAYPSNSTDLAELIGIILGDGCISKRQITISLNATDDIEYGIYITKLVEKLFHYSPSIVKRSERNVIIIILARVNIVDFLLSKGMLTGNKVKHQITVPDWIRNNSEYSKGCLKGLIDTDGCIYVDKHIIRTRLYKHLGLNFSNRSVPLIDFVKTMFDKLGYHSTSSNSFSVFIRRKKEIRNYMEVIGSSNFKFLKIFTRFVDEKEGRVAELV
jgi:intein/homing endonuclease